MKRARLIYNPSSGREEMKRRLPDILDRLDKGGIEASCHATTGEGDATVSAAKAIEDGYDLIIAAGGDGTIYEVINGMAEYDNPPPLGVFPLGTTNDLSRALGVPKNWEDYCDLVIRQNARPIDVGRFNDRYFINIAGGGSLTELTYEVPSRLKTMIGQMAYYMKGIEKVVNLTPTELKITANGQEPLHEEFMIFLVANTNSVGGFEKLVPGARIDDGLFDFIGVKKCNIAEFIRLISIAARGEHLNDPKIIYFQTDRLEIEAPSNNVQINLDGELGGSLPGIFEILPQKLQVFSDLK